MIYLGQVPISQAYAGDKEKFKAFKNDIMFNVHCCLPCIVQSFNRETMTIEAQPVIRERVIGENGQIEYINYPLLINVPVLQYGAKNYCISFPIEEGDECLVFFSDLSIDNWWLNGGVQNPVEQRRHDLSDGFAIFGIMNQEKMKENKFNNEPPVEGLSMFDTKSGAGITVVDGDVKLTVVDGISTKTYSMTDTFNLIWNG